MRGRRGSGAVRGEERRAMTKGLSEGFVALTLVAALSGDAIAQAAYPAKGQSPQQQQQDMAECQAWAAQQPGTSAPPPPSGPTGQGARGAARGAAVGATAGAIGGDAGKGAAAGAAAGAMVGGMQRRQDRRAATAASANASSAMSNAMAACLEGRGYTVK
jgi:outer membrane protein with glycine zipper